MGVVALVGRILLSLIFILSGLHKIGDFGGTVAMMGQHGIPMTTWLAVGAILVEVGGGMGLVLGVQTRLAATLMALFLVPTTLIFHSNFQQQAQMINFLKNAAIIGGLLMLAVHGPGAISIDGVRRRR